MRGSALRRATSASTASVADATRERTAVVACSVAASGASRQRRSHRMRSEVARPTTSSSGTTRPVTSPRSSSNESARLAVLWMASRSDSGCGCGGCGCGCGGYRRQRLRLRRLWLRRWRLLAAVEAIGGGGGCCCGDSCLHIVAVGCGGVGARADALGSGIGSGGSGSGCGGGCGGSGCGRGSGSGGGCGGILTRTVGLTRVSAAV